MSAPRAVKPTWKTLEEREADALLMNCTVSVARSGSGAADRVSDALESQEESYLIIKKSDVALR